MLDEEFERTVDAEVEGDITQILRLIQVKPELVNQSSQYGHRATLLHYIAANGVESCRQITSLNAPDVTRCLILAGADVNAIAEIHGSSTALNLVLTSAHPHNAGVTVKIADVLREAGAI